MAHAVRLADTDEGGRGFEGPNGLSKWRVQTARESLSSNKVFASPNDNHRAKVSLCEYNCRCRLRWGGLSGK